VPTTTISSDETVRFTVSLHAPAQNDVPLVPCPDYTIWLKGLSVTRSSYALNCAAVPFHDAAGNPILPAGSTVAFAMQLTMPHDDSARSGTTVVLGWSLNTEDQTGSTTLLTLA
jgi:hypothetical protein